MPSHEKKTKEVKSKKQPTKLKPTAKGVPSSLNFKSAEYIEGSDVEENAGSAEGSTSSDESLPKNLERVSTKPNGKLSAPSGSKNSSSEEESSSASGSGSGSEDEGDKEEEKDEPATSGQDTKPSAEPVKKSTAAKTSKVVAFGKPLPYKPPSGFQAAEVGESLQLSQTFKKSNLLGKQVWYFTAPAHVPVSSIEHISLQDAKQGNPILSYDGEQYGFVLAKPHTNSSNILVPHGSDNGYRTTTKKIDRVFSLQQIPKFPGPEEVSPSNPSAVKLPRPQPKGMKIRFQPVGCRDKNIGDLGTMGNSESACAEEMEDAPTFRKPAAVDSDQEMIEAPPITVKSSSKSKKERKERDEKKEDKSSTHGQPKRKRGEEKEKTHKSKKSDRNPDHAKRSIGVN